MILCSGSLPKTLVNESKIRRDSYSCRHASIPQNNLNLVTNKCKNKQRIIILYSTIVSYYDMLLAKLVNRRSMSAQYKAMSLFGPWTCSILTRRPLQRSRKRHMCSFSCCSIHWVRLFDICTCTHTQKFMKVIETSRTKIPYDSCQECERFPCESMFQIHISIVLVSLHPVVFSDSRWRWLFSQTRSSHTPGDSRGTSMVSTKLGGGFLPVFSTSSWTSPLTSASAFRICC